MMLFKVTYIHWGGGHYWVVAESITEAITLVTQRLRVNDAKEKESRPWKLMGVHLESEVILLPPPPA